MTQMVDVAVDGAVAVVTVDNPPVNALGERVLEALVDAAQSVARDARIRAVVLTGAGERTFLAGADLRELEHVLGDPAAMAAHVALTSTVICEWAGLDRPVVAGVTGHAVGGGLEIALACDLIVADPRARLGVPEVGLGLIPGAGATQRLPRRVGLGVARRLLLTGELITAPAALDLGLVDVVAAEGAALPEAIELAQRLATQPALAIRAAKQALAAASLPLADGLAEERRLFLGVSCTADAQEGASAFLAKREPEFTHA
jgi:enoyl-CoA hydratase